MIDEEIKTLSEQLATLKDKKQDLKMHIRTELEAQGMKSAKYDTATVSIKTESTLKVIDNKKLVEWLKSTGQESLVEEVPAEQFSVLAKQIVDSNVEVPGTIIKDTVFVSIRKAK